MAANAKMTVLALDVGFRNTGWAVIEQNNILAYGVIQPTLKKGLKGTPSRKLSQAQLDIACMKVLAKKLQQIAQDYSITRVIGEVPGGGARGARALSCMAMSKIACGIALMDYPCLWLAPTKTKEAAVAAVQERWPGWEPTGVNPAGIRHHVFDALSIYICAMKGDES